MSDERQMPLEKPSEPVVDMEAAQQWSDHVLAGNYNFVLKGVARAIRHLRAEVEALRAQVQRRDLLLQSLTPMGSEYVNDPERCAAYAHETRRAHFERWKKAALALKASDASRAALVKALEKIKRHWANQDMNHEDFRVMCAQLADAALARPAQEVG